jgi:hypothetical protein
MIINSTKREVMDVTINLDQEESQQLYGILNNFISSPTSDFRTAERLAFAKAFSSHISEHIHRK